jgi:restriction endonuclease Mrr
MLPFLRILQDGNEHRFRDVIEAAADHFGLKPEEREQLLPSGTQRVFDNRMGWACTYLKKGRAARISEAMPKPLPDVNEIKMKRVP